MRGVVVFDLELFRQMYPRFTALSDAELLFFFNTATLRCGNTLNSRIPYDPPRQTDRETILYLLTCHLATLSARGDVVGTVTGATEGSVNTSLSMVQRTGAAWWDQTQCGSTAWELLKPYRTGGRYIHGC